MAPMLTGRFGGLLLAFALLACCTSVSPPPRHLAIANGNNLRVFDGDTGQALHDVTRYSEVTKLAYRPDGERVAVAVCFGNRVVELETSGYAELSAPITAAACPWDVSYAPDGQSLAAATPFRPDPLGAMLGHLQIVGPQPL